MQRNGWTRRRLRIVEELEHRQLLSVASILGSGLRDLLPNRDFSPKASGGRSDANIVRSTQRDRQREGGRSDKQRDDGKREDRSDQLRRNRNDNSRRDGNLRDRNSSQSNRKQQLKNRSARESPALVDVQQPARIMQTRESVRPVSRGFSELPNPFFEPRLAPSLPLAQPVLARNLLGTRLTGPILERTATRTNAAELETSSPRPPTDRFATPSPIDALPATAPLPAGTPIVTTLPVSLDVATMNLVAAESQQEGSPVSASPFELRDAFISFFATSGDENQRELVANPKIFDDAFSGIILFENIPDLADTFPAIIDEDDPSFDRLGDTEDEASNEDGQVADSAPAIQTTEPETHRDSSNETESQQAEATEELFAADPGDEFGGYVDMPAEPPADEEAVAAEGAAFELDLPQATCVDRIIAREPGFDDPDVEFSDAEPVRIDLQTSSAACLLIPLWFMQAPHRKAIGNAGLNPKRNKPPTDGERRGGRGVWR